MSQDSDPKAPPKLVRKNKKDVSQTTAPHLRFVVSHTTPASPSVKEVIPVSQAAPPLELFSIKTTNKGPHLYEMIIKDPSHYLSCTLTLEREIHCEEGRTADEAVLCYFPPIDDEGLKKFIEYDETLYAMAIVQFQMKILEMLLLFCAKHEASELVIYMDNRQAEKFRVYADFLSHWDGNLVAKGEQAKMFIPADQKAFDQWISFMDKMSQNFRKTLWREGYFNSVIQSYLKWDPCLEFFY